MNLEKVFREHAADLNATAAGPCARLLAFDGKALKGSFDSFNDTKARQVLSAFAVDTALAKYIGWRYERAAFSSRS
jgi:hypothetical protein